ncbi:MAG: HEAT repeat protein [Planctomycetota bacterium]|jgi:HEAT repeat protein
MNCTTLTLLALLATGDNSTSPGDPSVADLRAHYSAAEAELRAAPQEDLTEAQRARRADMLDALAAYRQRGDFGVADYQTRLRPLRFVDEEGRRCAVAELLHVSGRDDLVEFVASTNNNAFVAELAGLEELGLWLKDVGLTMEEAARIQGPAGGGWGGGGGPSGSGGAWGGPGDRGTPPGPGTGGSGQPTSGGRPAPPSGPRFGGAPSTGAAPMGVPIDIPVSREMRELLGSDWWSWWEFSKVGFLGAERIVQELADDRTRVEDRRMSIIRRVLPTLEEHLQDSNAAVRAAAAVSYGRIAGSIAVEELSEMLDDPSLEVREAALLGLGATGSEEAAHLLLSIAHEREVDGLDTWRDAEEVAILALALLRERGAGLGVDSMLPLGDGLIHEAAFLHAALAPSEQLNTRAREESALFQGKRRPQFERKGDFADVLAIEALREDSGDDVLAALLRASSERDIERRRSAITTLGAIDDPRADAPLRTAFETESDSVNRGLALIAIANTGSETAGEFLARVLEKGRSLDRPWAALALGVLAREHDDNEARAALRAGLKKERNRDNRRAIALSLGIAQDHDAVPDLIQRIQETRDVGSRVAYGYALGLIGDASAAPVLRAALEVERASLPRSELAQALATLRVDSDIPDLVESLRKANDPDASVQSAAALSFHGSLLSVPLLLEALGDANSPQAEAAAILAIGLVLDAGQPFAIAEELRDRNPFVAPAWFMRATQTTL